MKDIFFFIFFLLLILGAVHSCNNGKRGIVHDYLKQDSLMSARIGKKILYEKDSLMVVDYSFWGDTYTLSNGVKVNKKLVK